MRDFLIRNAIKHRNVFSILNKIIVLSLVKFDLVF